MKYPLPALALAAACAVPVVLAAQSKPIDAYVSVVDSKGEPATGLTPADFRVREDGVTREVLKVGPRHRAAHGRAGRGRQRGGVARRSR